MKVKLIVLLAAGGIAMGVLLSASVARGQVPGVIVRASLEGLWEGTTSQGLSIVLTVNEADRVTRMDLAYQQIGEMPPDPNCVHNISVELSTPIGADGSFNVAFSVPPQQTSDNTRLEAAFEGVLNGFLGDPQGMGQMDVTQVLLFCQRNPSQSARIGCGGESPFSCDPFGLSYDVSRGRTNDSFVGEIEVVRTVPNDTTENILTVPQGEGALLTDVIISNSNAGASCCAEILGDDTVRVGPISVPPQDTVVMDFMSGMDFTSGTTIRLRNDDNAGPLHFTVRGYQFRLQ